MPGNLTENNEMRKFKFYMFIHIIQMLFFFELLKVRMASRDFKLNFLLNNELTWIVNDLSAFKCLIWMKFNIVDIMYIEKSLHLRNCQRKNVGKQLKVIQMKFFLGSFFRFRRPTSIDFVMPMAIKRFSWFFHLRLNFLLLVRVNIKCQ